MPLKRTPPSEDLAEKFFNLPVYLNHARYLIEHRASVIASTLGNDRPGEILDIGCGDGSLSVGLLNGRTRLTLLDLSAPMLKWAQKNVPTEYRGQVSFVHGNFTDWSTDDTFDTILCVGVLAHVPSVEDFVSKISQMLKPGGIAVFELTSYRSIYQNISALLPLKRVGGNIIPEYQINEVSADELIALAESLGLNRLTGFRYQLYLPLSRFFPQRLLKTIITWSSGRLLSRFGSEQMIFFQKRCS